MDRLVVKPQLVGSNVLVNVSFRDLTASGAAPFEFDEQVSLPAILKILNAPDFHEEDYADEERAYLQDRRLITRGSDGFTTAPGVRQLVGEQLFRNLFPKDTRSVFAEAYRGGPLAIELDFDVDTPVVGALPWELLFYDDDFIIAGGRGSLSRRLTYVRHQPAWKLIDSDVLNVLLIAPRPRDAPLLDQSEADSLKAIEALRVEQLTPPSISALADYLDEHRRERAPHVIHFDGHGRYGRRCRNCRDISPRLAPTCRNPACNRSMLDPIDMAQGYLAWEAADGCVEYVSAHDLANQVGLVTSDPESALRMMFVSACRSAAAIGGGSAFSGIAQRLIKTNIPAVVAMQFEVRADKATLFARRLYRRILANDPLTEALGWARTTLGLEDDQWYRPVLYLRAQDNPEGQLFHVTVKQVQQPAAHVNGTANHAEVSAPAIAAVDPNARDDSLVDTVNHALGALVRLAKLPDQLLRYGRDIEGIHDRLQVMSDYKDLHDQLHLLFLFAYTPLAGQLPAPGEVMPDELGMLNYVGQAEQNIAELERVASRGRVKPEVGVWIGQLRQNVDRLRTGVETANRTQIWSALFWIRTALDDRLRDINRDIIDRAAGLSFDRLEESLRLVASAPDIDASAVLASGAEALHFLIVRLNALLDEHNQWQQLEPMLRALVEWLERDVDAFALTWADLSQQVLKLCEGEHEAQLLSLRCKAVDDALQAHADVKQLKVLYASCTSGAGLRFYNVDRRLKEFCGELRDLGGTLDALELALKQTV